jgi:Fe-S-cluster containining protein
MIYKSVIPLKKIESITREVALESEKRRLTVYQERIKCKPGCSHCCSRQIHLTLGEAQNIRKKLISIGKYEETKARIEALKEFEDLDFVTWFKMNLKCPVLDPETQRCLAYEVRPLTCSIHFSESDPSSCDPWSMSQPDFKPVDMVDLFDKAIKKMSGVSARNFWSVSLVIHRAIEVTEKMGQVEGLSYDQVMELISRDL